MRRVVATAIEAALEGETRELPHDEPDRSNHRGLKAMAAGAALVGAVQVAKSQAPKLGKLDALTTLGKVTRLPDMVRDVPDRVRDRLADFGLTDEDDDDFDPDDLAEDDDLDDEEFDEPEAEADEDEDEEYDDEPEAEGDDDELEAEGDDDELEAEGDDDELEAEGDDDELEA